MIDLSCQGHLNIKVIGGSRSPEYQGHRRFNVNHC